MAAASNNLLLLYALQITLYTVYDFPQILLYFYLSFFLFSLSLSLSLSLLFIILSNGFHGGFILFPIDVIMVQHVNNNGFRRFTTHTSDINVLVAELITL